MKGGVMNEDKKVEILETIKKIDAYSEKIDIVKRDIKSINIYVKNEKQADQLQESIKSCDEKLLLATHSLTDIKWVFTNIINKMEE